jgi:hypothetical protein
MRGIVAVYERMAERCRERGVLLVALVLPTKYDVEPEDDRATFDAVRGVLGLDEEAAGLNRRLAIEFGEEMRARGIACVDPFAELCASEEPTYWRQDHHLGLRGHAVVAEVLARELDRLLPEGAR